MKRRHFLTATLCAAVVAVSRPAWSGIDAENVTLTGVTTGLTAPDFTLADTHGKTHALSDFLGQTVVLEWTNRDCPFVQKFYGSGAMQRWQTQATEAGVVWLTLCSSAPGKQGHLSPEAWNHHIAEVGMASTAVLLDGTGTAGKRYAAKTTPHIFVVDPEGVLRYQGAIDDTPSIDPADIDGAVNHLNDTIAAIAQGEPVQVTDTAPYGCSVKY